MADARSRGTAGPAISLTPEEAGLFDFLRVHSCFF
jgi:hypothetical protein